MIPTILQVLRDIERVNESRAVTWNRDERATKMQWREMISLHDLKREALEIWIDGTELWKKQTA